MPAERQPRYGLDHLFTHVRVSRRTLLKRTAALGLTVPVASALLAACETDDDAVDDAPDDPGIDPVDDDDEEPVTDPDDDDDDTVTDTPDDDRYGGTLNIALVDELSTFDNHQTTAAIIGFVMWHVYEHLYTYDEELNVIPELAAGQETSDDGLTYTIPIREGVPFHNGSDLTASDVVANLERWGQLSGRGQLLFEDVVEVNQIDDYTVEIQLSEPNGVIWGMLARHNNGCAIYPEEVIESVGLDPLTEYIGTGPYQFVEHVPDSYIHLQRFEDYARYGDEPNGFGGVKHAYVDEIYFRPVPDEAARVAGLQAGDYHILQSTSPDNFQQLDDDPNTVAEFLTPTNVLTIQLNTQDGPMSNPTMRQAVQAALDHEPILMAAYGDRETFRLESSWMPEELGIWFTEACGEYYSPNDADTSAALLEEAGYDGGTLRFVTSEHENFHINTALTAQQQLEGVGMNIEIEVYDWPTLSGEVRQDMSRWELITSGTSFRPDPSMFSPMDPQWGARWDSDRKRELLNSLMTEPDPDTRVQIWEDLQCLGYEEDVPFINLGKALSISAYSPVVQGWRNDLNLENPFFWNLWLEA